MNILFSKNGLLPALTKYSGRYGARRPEDSEEVVLVAVSWMKSSVPVQGGKKKPKQKKNKADEKSGIERCCKPGFQRRIKLRLLPPVLHTDPPTLCVRVRIHAGQNPTLVCIALSIRSAGSVLWLTGVWGSMDYFWEMWKVPQKS